MRRSFPTSRLLITNLVMTRPDYFWIADQSGLSAGKTFRCEPALDKLFRLLERRYQAKGVLTRGAESIARE